MKEENLETPNGENYLMMSDCGVIFPWIKCGANTTFFAPIKKLGKMFKVKIVPKEKDLCLNFNKKRQPAVFLKGKWELVV